MNQEAMAPNTKSERLMYYTNNSVCMGNQFALQKVLLKNLHCSITFVVQVAIRLEGHWPKVALGPLLPKFTQVRKVKYQKKSWEAMAEGKAGYKNLRSTTLKSCDNFLDHHSYLRN